MSDTVVDNKTSSAGSNAMKTSNESSVMVKCLKCVKTYKFPTEKDDYLAHIYLEHRLVIGDVEEISLLEEYLTYWEHEFTDHELAEYCTTMFLDQLPDGTPAKNEKYYLLCDILPKDFELRRALEKQRLDDALERHQFERTDRTFSKECLYCRDIISGLRADYFAHLYEKHFLVVGKPEKLVYVDELLTKLEKNLEQLICLFCEKVFKDRVTLKEHMRKKGHKRINLNLKAYDKYFLCNYSRETAVPTTAAGRQKRAQEQLQYRHRQQQQHRRRQSERSEVTEEEVETESMEFERRFAVEDDSDWSDWDGEAQLPIKCLFCDDTAPNLCVLKLHMMTKHCVDFEAAIKDLNFYQRIKVVNFVRRQMCLLRCISCDLQFDDHTLLSEHMQRSSHCGVGTQKQWDKPEYFFPYLENDGLLCVLDDNLNEDVDETVVRIISEDGVAQINKDAERLSLENFNL